MKSVSELLRESSFNDIRNIDICEQAGVSYGVLNLRFKDKKELIIHLLEYFFDNFQSEFDRYSEKRGEEDDVYVRLFDTINYVVISAETNLGIWRVMTMESDRHPELGKILAKVIDYWSTRIASVVPNEMAGRKLNRKDKLAIGVILGGMLDNAIQQFFLVQDRIVDFPAEKFTELNAILRYRALFAEDPRPESVRKARRLAKRMRQKARS